jgi:hypothetical protein
LRPKRWIGGRALPNHCPQLLNQQAIFPAGLERLPRDVIASRVNHEAIGTANHDDLEGNLDGILGILLDPTLIPRKNR